LKISQSTKTGTIPTALGACTNLKQIKLYHNGLTGTIPEFSTLIKLQDFALYQNAITGTHLVV